MKSDSLADAGVYSAEVRFEPNLIHKRYIKPSVFEFQVAVIDPYPPTDTSKVFVGFRCLTQQPHKYSVGQDPMIFSQHYYQKYDNVRTMSKEAFMVDVNGTKEALPKFITFDN